MYKYRFYYPHELIVHNSYLLDVGNSQQIIKVLRLKLGQEICLFNNTAFNFVATIQAFIKKTVQVAITAKLANCLGSPGKIYLAQAIAKGRKMDYIIQKSVELGVTGIIPLITERTIVNIAVDKILARMEHWQKIIIGACCQCGRSELPIIYEPMAFKDYIKQWSTFSKLILAPNSKIAIVNVSPQEQFHLLVGPEGGFSLPELAWAREHNCIEVNLGPRILRTETASIVALTALQLQFGDLR